MTAEEKMLWEQAVQVLKRNTVTRSVDPRSKQVLAKAREQATSHRRAA